MKLNESTQKGKNIKNEFLCNHPLIPITKNNYYPLKIPALPKDLPKKHNRRKKKNTYVKSDNTKFETTIFNNQNTLLFSKNTYIDCHDKIDNNLLISNNNFSNIIK